MELRDIEYFAVIAEHGHLGRAADVLGLSQPAFSKSLRRLEQALQVKLVKAHPEGGRVDRRRVRAPPARARASALAARCRARDCGRESGARRASANWRHRGNFRTV